MPRPITLFTGQWADLPLADLAAKAAEWGYDGLELACWGDHFDVAKALADPGYAILESASGGRWVELDYRGLS
jgi:sugar phosphate isomerase/epimerase